MSTDPIVTDPIDHSVVGIDDGTLPGRAPVRVGYVAQVRV